MEGRRLAWLVLMVTRQLSATLVLVPCGELRADLHLAAFDQHLLGCEVIVPAGVTLSIAAGTTIVATRMAESTPTIVVAQGGRIYANGTTSAPITFTSLDQTHISSATVSTDSKSELTIVQGVRGKWGGIVLNGRAPINARAGQSTVEGLGGRFLYGGSNPHDSSGVLRYVRIWHAGAVVGVDDEINGLTLAGVGNGTVIEYLEVAFSLDDGERTPSAEL